MIKGDFQALKDYSGLDCLLEGLICYCSCYAPFNKVLILLARCFNDEKEYTVCRKPLNFSFVLSNAVVETVRVRIRLYVKSRRVCEVAPKRGDHNNKI